MENLIEIRRELHRRAELSFEEHRTQQYICEVLENCAIPYKKIAGTGVMAVVGDTYAKSGAKLPAIVLRADIDALPIEEGTGVDYCSVNKGVMHACGHDMHAAMLIGALFNLTKNPPKDRVVIAIFQPGEEVNPGGALMVLQEGVLDQYDVRAVVGQHCSPELEVGQVGYRAGQFMASTDEIHLRINGHGGHAARPEELRNPVTAAIELLFELDKIRPADSTPHLLSFGRIIANGATNVIPDQVVVAGTFRTFDEKWRKECKALITSYSNSVAKKHNLDIEVDIRDGYPVVYNDEKLTAQAVRILKSVAAAQDLPLSVSSHSPVPSISPVEIDRRLTAEDFGHYAARYPSLFLRLGVGTPTRLHTAGFSPDERALLIGSTVLTTLAQKLPILTE